MELKDLQELINAAVSKAATDAAETAVKTISVEKSGAERLVEDLQKRLDAAETSTLKAVEDLRAEVKEKQAELEALQKSKMTFEDKKAVDSISYKEKETAVLLAKATGKKIEETKAFQNLVTKFGAHIPSATWELEVSTNMQDEIRRALVVAPVFARSVTMNNPVMRIPVNPEAGYANWVLEAAYKADTSSGTAQDHALKEVNLTAYKLATKEYLGSEEEDDSIIPLLPLVRDAMVRRNAKAWDKALLRGAGAGADPIKGIATCAAAAETLSVAVANSATIANLIAMRRKLGTLGLNPQELVFVVSNEVYYDLLDDTAFQTMDKVGTNATLITGQVGAVAGIPVILSGEFEAKAATKVGAVLVNQNNFLIGAYKGLRVESDYSVEAQKRILVASQRVGFQQIATVDGNGVATFKWIA
jgi:HK97 family phage major capsid protein